MSVRLQWDGLAELRTLLRQLPDDLATEGGAIVLASANEAFTAIETVYVAHQRSGRLRAGLSLVQSATGRFGASILLISRAPHAWIFEHGTAPREGAGGRGTGKGARHGNQAGNRGASPAFHAFIPAVAAARTRMYDALAALLERAGFVVTRAA